ncbi:MAG: hypothetical protein HIU91_06685 [Acidobacteria bacterium]|nr:hypothetical protein [Acidobacteriota bacterium]
MLESIKIDRKLPPHELNARRARKRAITHLPAIAKLPSACADTTTVSHNCEVYNPATNRDKDHPAKH